MKKPAPILLMWIHGLYFFLPGLWPLVHMPSFVAVSGPKKEIWLVETVGLLLVVIGTVLITAAYRREYVPALAVLAAGTSLGLTWIDGWYVWQGRIWDIYLLDAAAETGLLAAWICYLFPRPKV